MGRRKRWAGRVLACAVAATAGALCPALVRADTPEEPSVDESTLKGREAYLRGLALKKEEQWEEALVAFQKSESFRDSPLVQYSIGYCLRALGRYVAARERFARALAVEDKRVPTEEAKAYLGELDRLVVRVNVTLEPSTAALAVDGRPLRPGKDGDKEAMLASVEPPGPGRSPGRGRFLLLIEPGTHIYVATREGHEDAVVRRTYRAGDTPSLDLHLEMLPARVTLQSTPVGGIVSVEGRQVGFTPMDFERPAGEYRVTVGLNDYEDWTQTLTLQAGQQRFVTAPLARKPPWKKWWFGPAIVLGAAMLGAAVGLSVYFTNRPSPAYNSGNTGWLVNPTAFRW